VGENVQVNEAYLCELSALCQAATPGPWEWGEDKWGVAVLRTKNSKIVMALLDIAEVGLESCDRALIAAARTAIPALIAEVRKLRWEREGFLMEVANLKAELDNYRQAYADSVAEGRKLRSESHGWPSGPRTAGWPSDGAGDVKRGKARRD
jgi:hypothetical protein